MSIKPAYSSIKPRHFRNIRGKAKPWKRALAAKMSRNKTWPEKKLWAKLRDCQLGVRVHAQKVILGFIADFWCPKAGLVIEVDGPCHNKRREYDAHRDLVMRLKGIDTMRFTAQEVENNLPAVVALIANRIRKRMS